MADFRIKQGYAVPITGEAERTFTSLPHPPFIGICPIEFKGIKPKLSIKADDLVKVGTPLFFNKANPDCMFVAPASGRIANIKYGPRRVVEEIVIATGETDEFESFDRFSLEQIEGLTREALLTALLRSGLWPSIRQRPFGHIADNTASPKAIFINCMNTAPLANDPNFSLDDQGEAFRAGASAMRVLCDEVHVVTRLENSSPAFNPPPKVQGHRFAGKHPAGLVGTHIAKINPINKGEAIWYLDAQSAVSIGSFLLHGRFPVERIVALAGPGVTQPQYFRTRLGVRIEDLIKGRIEAGEQRYISGDVLAGTTKSKLSFLGFYDDLLTVLPEGREQRFLGWMAPGLNKPSFTRALLSAFMPGKKFAMDTNLNGGSRAIIQSGLWEQVVAVDVHPEFLVKACIAQDIDAMEQLGILECAPEDFALCTYVCPSKTEVSQIIADGLDLMEKEG